MLQNLVILSFCHLIYEKKSKEKLEQLTTLRRVLMPTSCPELFSLMSLTLEITPAGMPFKVDSSSFKFRRGSSQAFKRVPTRFSKKPN